ncbi:MAG: 30S ribosomal protein S16 [Brumimicrobium sp.]|nr:30S ribosomal protein S16 [Brumimicrobium sp.]MCO5268537.1 30S ribosomal protein S16 [Brumimicrobium sp.]
MATKIRLQRHGKKGNAFYHLVVADSRAKRDGRFIEKLGTYNPNTNPASIDINFDRTLHWVGVGAEMSDTARAILSYKGVLYKNHLLRGVVKGALTEADVEKKFAAWLSEKESKITKKAEGHVVAKKKEAEIKLAAEKEAKEAKAKAIEAKNTPQEEVVAEEASAEETANEEAPVAEAPAEEPVAEAPAEEPAAEAPAEGEPTEEN